MILHIDTKDKDLISVSLSKGLKEVDRLSEKNEFGSQVLLPLIVKLLGKNEYKFEDLESIEVEKGAGSFTGLRVGVSVANSLGYSLGIPVNGKEIEVDLEYS